MKTKLITLALLTILTASAYACFKVKQCCKRDLAGGLVCIQRCDYEYCPLNYPMELQ